MRTAIYFLEYAFFRSVAFAVHCLPYPIAVKLGRGFGTILFLILKKRRKISLNNLKDSYPEKNERELRSIARDAFRNMGQIAIEVVCIPKLIKKGFVKNIHTDRVWKALEQKKGAIFVVSHLTNWEVMAVATASAGFPMHAIARPLKNPFVYRYVKHLRGIAGLKSIDKEGAIRETLTLLKQNQVVAFLIDQHERQGAVKVQFFGRPCYTSNFVARIAGKWKVPVIFNYCYRNADGSLVTDYEEPFELAETGDEEMDVLTNTQIFVSAIERKIREMPGNWLWMHRRWRV